MTIKYKSLDEFFAQENEKKAKPSIPVRLSFKYNDIISSRTSPEFVYLLAFKYLRRILNSQEAYKFYKELLKKLETPLIYNYMSAKINENEAAVLFYYVIEALKKILPPPKALKDRNFITPSEYIDVLTNYYTKKLEQKGVRITTSDIAELLYDLLPFLHVLETFYDFNTINWLENYIKGDKLSLIQLYVRLLIFKKLVEKLNLTDLINKYFSFYIYKDAGRFYHGLFEFLDTIRTSPLYLLVTLERVMNFYLVNLPPSQVRELLLVEYLPKEESHGIYRVKFGKNTYLDVGIGWKALKLPINSELEKYGIIPMIPYIYYTYKGLDYELPYDDAEELFDRFLFPWFKRTSIKSFYYYVLLNTPHEDLDYNDFIEEHLLVPIKNTDVARTLILPGKVFTNFSRPVPLEETYLGMDYFLVKNYEFENIPSYEQITNAFELASVNMVPHDVLLKYLFKKNIIPKAFWEFKVAYKGEDGIIFEDSKRNLVVSIWKKIPELEFKKKVPVKLKVEPERGVYIEYKGQTYSLPEKIAGVIRFYHIYLEDLNKRHAEYIISKNMRCLVVNTPSFKYMFCWRKGG